MCCVRTEEGPPGLPDEFEHVLVPLLEAARLRVEVC